MDKNGNETSESSKEQEIYLTMDSNDSTDQLLRPSKYNEESEDETEECDQMIEEELNEFRKALTQINPTSLESLIQVKPFIPSEDEEEDLETDEEIFEVVQSKIDEMVSHCIIQEEDKKHEENQLFGTGDVGLLKMTDSDIINNNCRDGEMSELKTMELFCPKDIVTVDSTHQIPLNPYMSSSEKDLVTSEHETSNYFYDYDEMQALEKVGQVTHPFSGRIKAALSLHRQSIGSAEFPKRRRVEFRSEIEIIPPSQKYCVLDSSDSEEDIQDSNSSLSCVTSIKGEGLPLKNKSILELELSDNDEEIASLENNGDQIKKQVEDLVLGVFESAGEIAAISQDQIITLEEDLSEIKITSEDFLETIFGSAISAIDEIQSKVKCISEDISSLVAAVTESTSLESNQTDIEVQSPKMEEIQQRNEGKAFIGLFTTEFLQGVEKDKESNIYQLIKEREEDRAIYDKTESIVEAVVDQLENQAVKANSLLTDPIELNANAPEESKLPVVAMILDINGNIIDMEDAVTAEIDLVSTNTSNNAEEDNPQVLQQDATNNESREVSIGMLRDMLNTVFTNEMGCSAFDGLELEHNNRIINYNLKNLNQESSVAVVEPSYVEEIEEEEEEEDSECELPYCTEDQVNQFVFDVHEIPIWSKNDLKCKNDVEDNNLASPTEKLSDSCFLEKFMSESKQFGVVLEEQCGAEQLILEEEDEAHQLITRKLSKLNADTNELIESTDKILNEAEVLLERVGSATSIDDEFLYTLEWKEMEEAKGKEESKHLLEPEGAGDNITSFECVSPKKTPRKRLADQNYGCEQSAEEDRYPHLPKEAKKQFADVIRMRNNFLDSTMRPIMITDPVVEKNGEKLSPRQELFEYKNSCGGWPTFRFRYDYNFFLAQPSNSIKYQIQSAILELDRREQWSISHGTKTYNFTNTESGEDEAEEDMPWVVDWKKPGVNIDESDAEGEVFDISEMDESWAQAVERSPSLVPCPRTPPTMQLTASSHSVILEAEDEEDDESEEHHSFKTGICTSTEDEDDDMEMAKVEPIEIEANFDLIPSLDKPSEEDHSAEFLFKQQQIGNVDNMNEDIAEKTVQCVYQTITVPLIQPQKKPSFFKRLFGFK